MDNRDVEKLDRVLKRTFDRQTDNELTRDLERWGPWIAAVVLFGFGAWVLGVYINAAVLYAVEKIGGAL